MHERLNSPTFENLRILLENCPKNQIIGDNLVRANKIINDPKYQKILCSISGGADSDIVLDIVHKCDINKKVDYVWFDTGLEYQVTKEHLEYLEKKYGITFIRYKAIKSIPKSCKEHGEPFVSKYVSEMIFRLQRHDFKWEDKSFEELYTEYPNCKSALQWWCNLKSKKLNISNNKLLKEFLIQNKPTFAISSKCCDYAKKNVAHKIVKENQYDLVITGIRKNEGGVRSTAYQNCFDTNDNSCDNYRPIFWYKNQEKQDYEEHYQVLNSRCYTEYGLKRTGCAGCPYGRNFEFELEVLEKYEPKLFKAVNNIFKNSYDFTRKYNEFKKNSISNN